MGALGGVPSWKIPDSLQGTQGEAAIIVLPALTKLAEQTPVARASKRIRDKVAGVKSR